MPAMIKAGKTEVPSIGRKRDLAACNVFDCFKSVEQAMNGVNPKFATHCATKSLELLRILLSGRGSLEEALRVRATLNARERYRKDPKRAEN